MCPVHRGIRDADDDFAFAASAKVLVRGGGGYSKFMADLARKRGGKVLTPHFMTEINKNLSYHLLHTRISRHAKHVAASTTAMTTANHPRLLLHLLTLEEAP